MKNKQPFIRKTLDEDKGKKDIFSVKLDDRSFSREQLDKDKKLLQQVKDSTALKQLASIGSKVINDAKTHEILEIINGNSRRNRRIGIVDFEQD